MLREKNLGLPAYHCLKCDHRWNGRMPTTPQKCPACGQRKWWQPKRKVV